ncbi:hypothetical protein DTI93_04145 [Parasaccharibacter sp. TMW 2.1884]|nr:hypothetical protein [Parasaccharibacter sp. TMW 2.1884]
MLSRGSRGPRLSPRSACLTGLKEEVSTKGTPQRTGFHQALKDDLVRSLPYGGWGNRRFMPINVGSHCLDFGWLAENRDQLWAEAYQLFCYDPAFETCEPSYLKEEIEQIRRESMVSDILEETVINLIEGDTLPDADGKGGFTVASIIRALSLPMTRAMEMRVSNILRKLGGEKQRQRTGKGRFYVWQFNHMVTG